MNKLQWWREYNFLLRQDYDLIYMYKIIKHNWISFFKLKSQLFFLDAIYRLKWILELFIYITQTHTY